MKSILLKFAISCFNITINIVLYFVALVDKDGNYVMRFFREIFLKRFNVIIDYNLRALYPSKYFVPSRINTTTEKGELAIVIQGVITEKDDFTLETVRFYKMLFKDAHIIISTWDFTKSNLLKRFEDEGCYVVVSKNFKPSGLGNINYQICTTFAGIKKAKELGAKYILKNRSDLRIYREFSFEFLKSLLEVYPVSDDKTNQRGRIITLSGLGPQVISVNGFQDFMYFGFTEDIYNLFDIPYDTRGDEVFASSSRRYFDNKFNGKYSAANVCEELTPEVYITTSFLSKYLLCGMTVKDSWTYFRKYFLVVDFKAIEAVWYKYQMYSIYNETSGKRSCLDRERNYNSLISTCIITDKFKYEEWLEGERNKVVMGSKISKDWLKNH